MIITKSTESVIFLEKISDSQKFLKNVNFLYDKNFKPCEFSQSMKDFSLEKTLS